MMCPKNISFLIYVKHKKVKISVKSMNFHKILNTNTGAKHETEIN